MQYQVFKHIPKYLKGKLKLLYIDYSCIGKNVF